MISVDNKLLGVLLLTGVIILSVFLLDNFSEDTSSIEEQIPYFFMVSSVDSDTRPEIISIKI